MIDLKKLEAEIDVLLNSETPESLREWLNSQNKLDIYSYLGEGNFIATKCEIISFVEKVSHKEILLPHDNNKVDSTIYQMAA